MGKGAFHPGRNSLRKITHFFFHDCIPFRRSLCLDFSSSASLLNSAFSFGVRVRHKTSGSGGVVFGLMV